MKLTFQLKQSLILDNSGFFTDQLGDLCAELEQVALQVEKRSKGKNCGRTAWRSHKLRYGLL
jgi:hypothetical protein